jgi:hypothetical protein
VRFHTRWECPGVNVRLPCVMMYLIQVSTVPASIIGGTYCVMKYLIQVPARTYCVMMYLIQVPVSITGGMYCVMMYLIQVPASIIGGMYCVIIVS